MHVGRPVVHLGGGHQLTPLGDASDQQRLQVGTGGVYGRGVAGRARTEDQNLGVLGGKSVGHVGKLAEFGKTLKRHCKKLG
jgi:hypothetical protein